MSSDNTTPNWLSIPPTDPNPFIGHHLTRAVRNFHIMGQVVFRSPTCAMHKEAIMSEYMKTLDVSDIRSIADYCCQYLVYVTVPSSMEEHLQWMAVLVAFEALPASGIPRETIRMLVQDDQWRCMIHACPGCQKEPGRGEEAGVCDGGFGVCGGQ
ncbi:hypothetical protein C8A01DRAFT_36980 [Parachaetomium inaequale]|uniref:Uncharacterized protein n=1 Tax=Parachaetomium inaequale TaxID=2588326 RepID=A0AAN6SQ88_9PEZI|nr:hypothetical protein C8A01DRAFT_36980 [Parachaetomium inaequale]